MSAAAGRANGCSVGCWLFPYLSQSSLTTYQPDIPAIPALILCGQEATGKTLTITNVLSALGSPYAIIKSRECITGRHLMERTVLSCKAAVEEAGYGPFPSIDGRCENLSVLTVLLQQLLTLCRKFVIVFDGIDRQREASSTLLQALARLGEIVRLPPPQADLYLQAH